MALSAPAAAVRRLQNPYSRLPDWVYPSVTFVVFSVFALYLAAVQALILWYDVVVAFIYHGAFHFGFGNVLMIVNVVCLTGYTFGCHAFRHLVGGGSDCLSCVRTRYRLWKGVTVLNVNHATWAWVSLFTVWATDLYIRLLAHGWLPHGIWT